MSDARESRPKTVAEAQQSGVGGTGSPLRSRSAWLWLLGTVSAGLSSDLVSKYASFRWVAGQPVDVDREVVVQTKSAGVSLSTLIPPHDPVRVVPGLLDFTLVLNPGAVFGIGAGKRWFFVGFTVLALGLAMWMFVWWTRARDRWAHLGVGLLMAGGLGNLHDRLVYACVRDFIHPLPGVLMPFGLRNPLTGQREIWPYVSNVADLWLLIGIGLLLVHLWRSGDGPGPARASRAGV